VLLDGGDALAPSPAAYAREPHFDEWLEGKS
jgi:hypothetical protein